MMNDDDQLMMFEDDCIARDTVNDNSHSLDPLPSTSNLSTLYSQQVPLSEPENPDPVSFDPTSTLNPLNSLSKKFSLHDTQPLSYSCQRQQLKQQKYHHRRHNRYSSSVTPLTAASKLLSTEAVAAVTAVPCAKTAKKFCVSALDSDLPQVQCNSSFTASDSSTNLLALSRRNCRQQACTVDTELANQPAIKQALMPELFMPNAQTSTSKNSAIWDQWLCCLATSLTPSQWQTYWTNYLALFGTSALPPHIVRFFNTAAHLHLKQQSIWIDERQRNYGKRYFHLITYSPALFFVECCLHHLISSKF
uniref:RFX-type winged-helix domain-containing protein n=1 Tax=Syphacia muris TaxID=451379 RepID=A0A0N5ATB2_9BILA